jgi:hypothetical protein
LDKTTELLKHFLKHSARTSSFFHGKKSGGGPSVIHAVEIAPFKSAKAVVRKDLAHLTSSRPNDGSDVVYSIHYADINGLARIEHYILAHEISQYLGNNNPLEIG